MGVFQYEVFLSVVENGSFTKAGDKLGLSQSGVSHNISALEAELGILLLQRNRNGVALTDAGERAIPHIRHILHHARLLEQEAALIQGLEAGTVKIGSFPSFSAKFLPMLVSRFSRRHPGIRIELFEGGYESIKTRLDSGAIDIGFTTLPAKDCDILPLIRDPLFAVVPEEYPLSSMETFPVEAFHNQPFIMPKAGCDALIRRLMRERRVTPHILFELEDNNTILAMVREGIGMTVVPELVLSGPIPLARAIPLQTGLSREIGAAVKSFKSAAPSVQEFIKVLKEYFHDIQAAPGASPIQFTESANRES